jgi:tetratricopeptide (TPR) repeat protein
MFYGWLGQDEAVLREARMVLGLKDADQAPAHQGAGFAEMQAEARAKIAWLTGDFGNVVGWECYHVCAIGESALSHAKLAGRMHDAAQARALIVEAVAAGSEDQRGEDDASYFADAAAGRWSNAVADASAAQNLMMIPDGDENRRLPHEIAVTAYAPLLAEAEAHTGRFATAEAVISRAPGDCVACETARGEINALENQPDGAAYWFRRAGSDAPSIPFADTDWGAMLLREGNYDAAIDKFKQANLNGPHFADPLEMWGEALMRENRSDLALAKFAEANKYAPNWGRLHLEWGRALFYVGNSTAAGKEFDTAARLDLSSSDAAMLARLRARHV